MLYSRRFALLMVLTLLPAARLAADDGAGAMADHPTFCAELRAAEAVVTVKVIEWTPTAQDRKNNSVLSMLVRGEVTDVLKGGLRRGEVVEIAVVDAEVERPAWVGEGHLFSGGVPQVGQPGTFVLARDRQAPDRRWRAAKVLTTLVDRKYLLAYLDASEAQGAEAALRLAELFCELSFAQLRDKAPVYGFTRLVCHDVRQVWRELDPASEPFRRRLVARHRDAVLEQCARPTLLLNAEGWDAVVWLAACMDDAGRREAVRRLVAAHGASVGRVEKLPPRPPVVPGPGPGDPRACRSAPDPRDVEATLQLFLLSAIELVMEPVWRAGPPGKATGHLIPHEKLLNQQLKTEEVIPRARGFGVGVG